MEILQCFFKTFGLKNPHIGIIILFETSKHKTYSILYDQISNFAYYTKENKGEVYTITKLLTSSGCQLSQLKVVHKSIICSRVRRSVGSGRTHKFLCTCKHNDLFQLCSIQRIMKTLWNYILTERSNWFRCRVTLKEIYYLYLYLY